jgi:ribosome biogenesis GTPase
MFTFSLNTKRLRGIVTKSTGSWYSVRLENGTDVECRVKGKFRLKGYKLTNPLAVGDNVIVKIDELDENIGQIVELEERHNYIVRKSVHARKHSLIASNIDQALLLVTLGYPRTSTGFIDRFIASAERFNIPTVLVFNKMDQYGPISMQDLLELEKLYNSIGYDTLKISALEGDGIDELKEVMKDKNSLVSGHSGVGKSTLVNSLIPDLDIYTQEVTDYGKGQHTTTHAECYELNFGGWIIDTPGIKEFGLVDILVEDLDKFFVEIFEYKQECKFNNCLHYNEPAGSCAVKQAFADGKISESRYTNYLKLVEEIKDYKHYL